MWTLSDLLVITNEQCRIFDHLIAHHCDPEGKIADNVGRLAKERYFRAVVQVPERA